MRIVLGVTGASGVIYGVTLAAELKKIGVAPKALINVESEPIVAVGAIMMMDVISKKFLELVFRF